jgi:FAS-associated factor 2
MADDGNLSAEQTDQLICFQEITQIESIDECKQILEAFSWNVESAVQNAFNEKDRESATANTSSPPNSTSNLLNSQSSSQSSLNSMHANTSANLLNEFHEQTHNHFMNTRPEATTPLTPNYQRVSRISQSAQALPNVNTFTQRTLSYYGSREQPLVPQGFFQWSMFIVAFPFKFIFSTLLEIASAFLGFFESTAIPIDYDPLANIAEFAIHYNTKFGTNHIEFYQGSYAQAVNEAKRDLKFLVVYLHQNDNQDCVKFANDTMTSPDLINYLQTNTIFWACSKNLPEGQRVYKALRAKRCPFLGAIVYKNARMRLISKIEGPVSAAELLVQFAQLFSENEADLIVARHHKSELNQTRSIRDEQDKAYQESLAVDREKERIKKEKEEANLNAERLEKQRIEDDIAKENDIIKKRTALRQLLEETAEPDSTHPLSIKLLIKLPNGSRHQRIFLRTDSLCELYKFVFSKEDCPNNFEIAINFPKKVIECTETTELSIQDFGINQSMLLFVNDLDA